MSRLKEVKVSYYEAFSDIPGKGNPAGIVFDAQKLSEEEMQTIAWKVGFNETVFIQSSKVGDIRLRYFTPGHEIKLCGHGTVAAVYGLKEKGLLEKTADITIETLAGVIRVSYDEARREVRMTQAQASFIEYEGDVNGLAASMGIDISDLDERFPIVYGSTGVWTLLVPIKKVETFLRMRPDNKLFPELLKQIPNASVHPFCLETYDKTCDMHGRHFSSPWSGTVEDPVTGTASGVMGAYFVTFVEKKGCAELMVEQGYEIGRKGLVCVFVDNREGKPEVSIAGKAVFVEELLIEM